MSGKWWTTEEINYLEDSWGNKSIPAISKNLNRTINAVRSKAIKLGLGEHLDSGNYITFNQLIKALGYNNSYTWFLDRYIKYGCPIKTKKKLNHAYKVINIDEFWEWAEKNKEIVKFNKLEENSLGKEPMWVKEKRILDKNNLKIINNNRAWGKEEDNLLISKVKSYRYTLSDLAKDFGRTEPAIKKRLQKLNCPYRPVPRNNKEGWTREQNNKLKELFLKGYSSDYIAKKLNKSEFTVIDKIRILKINPDENFKTRIWTMQEELYLFKNKEKCNKELAIELNRSPRAIEKKKKRLDVNLMITMIEKQGWNNNV
ncbi:hypothetical protein [Clostridium sp. D53t1_180928_C8]|uniref:hypothetical protein n=1 Tax=Clostridium sp. D53t1_180928_C8 TaxID=2787101 RepID=UPI0018AA0F6D|nr:hypothetical protein [Clostridium sp. D53t1_180928_C8]